MPANLTIVTLTRQSLELWIEATIKDALPSYNDVIPAMVNQASRILERTAQGLDYSGSSFVAYNETHPFYYYPPGAAKGRTRRQQVRARNKLHKQLGGKGKRIGSRGIRFDSYGQFKRAFGSSVVNLMGVDPPNMLSAIELVFKGQHRRLSSAQALTASPLGTMSGEIAIGIYDAIAGKGSLASIHNEGLGRMPRREFWAVSQTDVELILADIKRNMETRYL